MAVADARASLAPPPGAPPLGSRLWLYTNFDCNLACDYCCAASSPRARPRRLPLAVVAARARSSPASAVARSCSPAASPSWLSELGELIGAAARWAPVTVLTNAMVFERGSRRRTLEALDRERVTLQVSLDSGTASLHDRHRAAGSFDRARRGIALARELGFHVRVAATVDASDAAEQAGLHRLMDADGVPPERPPRAPGRAHRSRRPRSSSSASRTSGPNRHWPPRRLVAPVGIAEERMQVASTPLPLITVLSVIHATLNDADGDRAAALQMFRCT